MLTLHPHFCCLLQPFAITLDPAQPVTADVLDGEYSARAQAWTLGDVVDGDGNVERMGAAGSECVLDVDLPPGTETTYEVTFRIGEPCRIVEAGREALP